MIEYSLFFPLFHNDFDIVKIKVVFDDNSEVVIDDKNILNELKFTLEESKLYSNPLNIKREL